MRERRIKRGCCRDKNEKPKRRGGEKRSGNSFNRLIISFKSCRISWCFSLLSSGARRRRRAALCLKRDYEQVCERKKRGGGRRAWGSSFGSEQPDSSFCKIKRSLGCQMLSYTSVHASRLYSKIRVAFEALKLEMAANVQVFGALVNYRNAIRTNLFDVSFAFFQSLSTSQYYSSH